MVYFEPPDLYYLKSIISNLFFQGKIDRVSISWDDKLEQDILGTTECDDDGISCDILINPTMPVYFDEVRSKLTPIKRLMGAVLHECAHGYISKNACFGKCGAYDCHWMKPDEVGAGGHGYPWYTLAAEIEKHAKSIISPSIQLSILNSTRVQDEEEKGIVWQEMFTDERE